MEGTRVSHYDILERLGGGGMGVVYKALDTKLGRHVALKFLPPEATREEEARARFVQEARAASALDHPNICTIHEIDSTSEGQMFIAMALYDGETLKGKIDRCALKIDDALDIAVQLSQGLTKAHEAGIVHRDIKPANVMVTSDGLVKILDFGIAKLLGVTGPTRAGSTLGTVSYMSPEQVDGLEADPRSDVWALGVVLYAMLTGALPFRGENEWAVMNAISNRSPDSIRSLRPEVPKAVEAVVMGALVKDREGRTESADALRAALEACRTPLTAGAGLVARHPWRVLRRPMVALPAVGLILALVVWSVLSGNRDAEEGRARAEGLPELLSLLARDDFVGAFALGEELERIIPGDPVLTDAMSASTITTTIETDPPGAEVYIRPYGVPGTQWDLLGPSPIESVRWPRGLAVQLRVERDGFEPRTLASGTRGFYFARATPEVIELRPLGSVPPDMVYVPAGNFPVRITGFPSDSVSLEGFLID